VRPLLGGYHAWKALGYPLEEVLMEGDNEPLAKILATEDLA
jgi:hypothetical protein